MAEIVGNEGGGGRHQKKRAKKGHVHMDMTPMVDLAFLLITFFILATTLSKPSILEITYPKEKDIDSTEITKIIDSLAITVLLGEKREDLFYYYGKFRQDTTKLVLTDFSKDGLRKVFLDKNYKIYNAIKEAENKFKKREILEAEFDSSRKKIRDDEFAHFVILKTIDETPYRSLVDAMDEMQITNISKFAVQDMSETEHILLRMTKGSQ
ncbi:MAG: biopolymer transporter ExbD [Flavobacteriales bacterium]|nr:biopolymer transporter ExbD [Flavobacteriales bacterium]